MAKKRTSSALASDTEDFIPQSRHSDMLHAALVDLCKAAEIELPYREEASPVSRGKSIEWSILHDYTVLFHKERTTLRRIEREFHQRLPTIPASHDQQTRLSFLHSLLAGPAQEIRKASTPKNPERFRDVVGTSSDIAPPSSPSVQKVQRIYQSFSVTKRRADPSRDDGKESMSTRTPADTSFSSTTVDSSSFATTANTSLSTTSDNTSFSRDQSFRSVAAEGSGNTAVKSFYQPHATGASQSATGEHDPIPFMIDGIKSRNGQARHDSSADPFLRHDTAEPHQSNLMTFTPASVFAQLKIPNSFAPLPFVVQWEAQRLLTTAKVSVQQLQEHKPTDLETFYQVASRLYPNFELSCLSSNTDTVGLTFAAKLQWAKKSDGPIFDLVPEPPRKEVSCELQRFLGADNVLYVNQPSLRKPAMAQRGRDAENKFRVMCSRPQQFFGREWLLLLVQPNKGKKSAPADMRSGTHRLIFVNVTRLSVVELMAHLIPYMENRDQKARKMYSRLDLSVSRTIAIKPLGPDDIVYGAKDRLSTEDQDDTTFLDPDLEASFPRDRSSVVVMDDGCSPMSLALARRIAQTMRSNEICSAYQCRIGGAKGLWYVQPEYDQTKGIGLPPGKHIAIRESQIKVKRASLRDCSPDCRALNVIKGTQRAVPSVLHTAFLPILLDRHVPREAIFEVVHTQVTAEKDRFLEALESPEAVRLWLSSKNQTLEDLNRERGIDMRGNLPARQEEKVIQLLESGFHPAQNHFLARELMRLAENVFKLERNHFKIRLPSSTTLMGIADPYERGVLEPGEVHVNFSEKFTDPTSQQSWQFLHGTEGLVARNPAMAPWDIQKVRFVFKQELQHLKDLIIFSVKGSRPLASMLQGGDYDGDTFWICWNSTIVKPFLNAPCPIDSQKPTPESLGITRCALDLKTFVEDPTQPGQWYKWLSTMAEARLQRSLLGTVTNYYERVIYKQRGIRSATAETLVHLHDNLVDADKQGYNFPESAWAMFKGVQKIPKVHKPRYWQFTKNEDEESESEVSESEEIDNIIDAVFFKVVQPMTVEALRRAHEMLSNPDPVDPDLKRFYLQTYDSLPEGDYLRTELDRMTIALKCDVRDFYTCNAKTMKWDDLVAECRRRYDAIQPNDTSHRGVVEWMRRQGHELTLWEKLKASAFAYFHYATATRGNLAFNVAGSELCVLKVNEIDNRRRQMSMDQYNILRPKKKKQPVIVREDEGSPEDEITDN